MSPQYFPAGSADDERKKRSAIVDPLINRPTSNVMDKAMSFVGGFMETGGGGMGGGMTGPAPGAGGSPGVPGGGAGTPPTGPNPGSAAGGTGAMPSTPPPNVDVMGQAMQWKDNPFGSAVGQMGGSAGAQQTAKIVGELLRSQQDPNQGATNAGRIAGLVKLMYGGV